MPGPYFDIYALAERRDSATLETFLDAYVDRAAAASGIGGLELMIEPLDAVTREDSGWDWWDWVPVRSLKDIVGWGLAYPRRTFTAYLPWCRGIVKSAVLGFTADDELIVGIAVYDDERGQRITVARAKVLLHDLMRLVGARQGLILAEGPPPRTAAEFSSPTRDGTFVFSIHETE